MRFEQVKPKVLRWEERAATGFCELDEDPVIAAMRVFGRLESKSDAEAHRLCDKTRLARSLFVDRRTVTCTVQRW